MASLTAQVNRRLASAKALLSELAVKLDRPPLVEQALLEAGLFHLYCGYVHYLRELSDYYGIKHISAINTQAQACQALEQLGKQSAELGELRQLTEQPESWLSLLLAHYQACWKSTRSDSSVNLIQTQRLDDVTLVELNRVNLERWFEAMRATIERHRQNSTEC